MRRERGQAEISYILILALVVVPLIGAVRLLYQVLQRYYEVTSVLLSQPYP